MAATVGGKYLIWEKMTEAQKKKIRRRVEELNEEERGKHLYLQRLRSNRLKSTEPYIVVPDTKLTPTDFRVKVWRRLGVSAYVARRILRHHVRWELLGPCRDGDRKPVHLLNRRKFPNTDDPQHDRMVLEDMAVALSMGRKMNR